MPNSMLPKQAPKRESGQLIDWLKEQRIRREEKVKLKSSQRYNSIYGSVDDWDKETKDMPEKTRLEVMHERSKALE